MHFPMVDPPKSYPWIEALDAKSSEKLPNRFLKLTLNTKKGFIFDLQYSFELFTVLGNFHVDPFQLLGGPFQWDVVGGTWVLQSN